MNYEVYSRNLFIDICSSINYIYIYIYSVDLKFNWIFFYNKALKMITQTTKEMKNRQTNTREQKKK